MVGAPLGLWIAAHRVPWVGPMVADGLRAVLGVQAVARLEDFAYGVQDRVNQTVRQNDAPEAYWEVPAAPAAAPPPTRLGECVVPPFRPTDVGPTHQSWSAPGDGTWVPIADPQRPGAAAPMYKTLLHPDPQRSWTAVSVVAFDLTRVELHLMAGRYEPRPSTPEGRKYDRKALIPAEHQAALLAAFNGGFKAEHGHHGMRVDGVTLIPPRSLACGVMLDASGAIVIGDWERLAPKADAARWWRQAPGCMAQDGQLHPGLRDRENTYWGATLDGKTVIRRSAIGVSADGKTLYSGIGDHTTARAIAVAMKHAGAAHVAQLDVNWSYPKLVLYRPSPAGPVAEKLCDGFEFSEDEYVRQPADRDFFYVTSKPDDAVARAACR
jgi:hypothetical protein